jgi:hypothetical protein
MERRTVSRDVAARDLTLPHSHRERKWRACVRSARRGGSKICARLLCAWHAAVAAEGLDQNLRLGGRVSSLQWREC